MERSSTMKAIEFKKFIIEESKNNLVLISTSFKVLDDNDNPVKNSILISKVLDNLEDIELKTDEKGLTSLSFYKKKSECQTKPEIDLIQFYTQQSINSNLIIKETVLEEKQELLKLPIGNSSFEKIRTENFLYIDKTSILKKMIEIGDTYCFLSRPRRFGKSMTISTLESLFKGKKELFKGLDIEKQGYKFEKYPVIRLDFSLNEIESKEDLNDLLIYLLKDQAQSYGLKIDQKNPNFFLMELGKTLVKKYKKRLVILIDEYDTPLLQNLGTKNRDEIQKKIKSFFTAIKGLNEIIHFVFVTGITNLSNMNMFSGANQFTDLSREEPSSNLVGYTESELYENFSAYIKETAKALNCSEKELKNDIKNYYNGYTFSDNGEAIYNPFSLLKFFKKKKFDNYWYKSGTPTFLLEVLKEKPINLAKESGIEASDEIFEFSQLEDLSVETLMFQAGYLVIKEKIHEKKYILDFPNIEVQKSFFESFLKDLLIKDVSSRPTVFIGAIQEALINTNMKLLKDTFNKYIKKIPYTINAKKDEAYYQTILHCLIVCSAYYPNAEMATNDGRSDHIVSTKNKHYCIEYKMASKNECPIKQIKEKKYYRAIQPTNKPIDLIGIKFDKNGNITEDIMIEKLK